MSIFSNSRNCFAIIGTSWIARVFSNATVLVCVYVYVYVHVYMHSDANKYT